jgi:hypothetical protein
MRDYSKNRFPGEREVRWYEWWMAYTGYLIILVIGPPIEWVCDRITELLDRVWPDRPKPPPGRIP